MGIDVIPAWIVLVRRELVVDSARWGRMLRMSACATLIATLFLVFRVPLPAYGAYVVLMASQRDVATSVVTAIGAFVAGTVAIGASLLLYVVDIDEPAMRVPVMALAMFAAMVTSRLPKIGPVAFLAGFLLVVTQTLVDQVPDAETLTHLLLWLLLVLAGACTLAPLVESIFGRSSRQVFEDGISEREAHVAALSGDGVATPPAIPVRELGALAGRLGADALHRLTHVLRLEQAAALRRVLMEGSHDEIRLRHRMERLQIAVNAEVTALPLASATVAPAGIPAVRFALKATLAAMACYVIYSALDWSGIRTAIITCFFVALGSTGETIHKLSLRLTGALLGGLLAGFSIVFLFPVMDDIGGFIVLFAVVTLGCTWVATASPLLSYAGLQMAFAFFLGVLQEYGPTDDLTVLRDRLVGIMLGNIAMSVVFATLWPVSTLVNIQTIVARVLARQAHVSASTLRPAPVDLLASAIDMEDIGRLAVLSAFEVERNESMAHGLRERITALADIVAWSAVLDGDILPSTRTWLAARLSHVAERYGDASSPPAPAVTICVAPDDLPSGLLHALDILEGRPPRAS